VTRLAPCALARNRFDHGRRMRNFRSVSTTKQRAKESRPSSRRTSPTRLTSALAPGSRRRTSRSPACVPGLNWRTSEKSKSCVIRNRSSCRAALHTSLSGLPLSPSDATVSTSSPPFSRAHLCLGRLSRLKLPKIGFPQRPPGPYRRVQGTSGKETQQHNNRRKSFEHLNHISASFIAIPAHSSLGIQ